MPGVTAIIPAYNEAERIATVIAAARAATRITEVLVVDDGSLDDTGPVAAALHQGVGGHSPPPRGLD